MTNDGTVSPADALVTINRLNAQGSYELPLPRPALASEPFSFDVNGDNHIGPLDVLLVINWLNRDRPSQSSAIDNPQLTTANASQSGNAEGESPRAENDSSTFSAWTPWPKGVVAGQSAHNVSGRQVLNQTLPRARLTDEMDRIVDEAILQEYAAE